MGNEEKRRKEEDVIDLLQIFRALKKRIWVILAVMVVFGGAAGAFSKFVLTPQFSSTTKMYILTKETTLTSLADLQIGSQLTQDYKIMATSRPVLEQVNEELNLGLEYEQLRQKLTLDNPADTRILSITATDPDPYRAKAIVDCVAETASDYIGEIMEMIPPKIIEQGVVAKHKISPHNTKNAMMGALAGIVLVCGITVLQILMNDTVQTEEDVEKYLGLSVLASVPLREGEGKDDGGTAKGRSRGQGDAGKKRRKNK